MTSKNRFLPIESISCLLLVFAVAGFSSLAAGSETSAADSQVDAVIFGDTQSENAHRLQAGSDASKVIDGELGAKVRQLLPPAEEHWRGGRMTFRMAVAPNHMNYFTAKFWGSDVTGEHSRLMLFLDGLQIGQRHLGEVEQLDIMADDARFPERFFYKTLPLPLHLTQGKTEVEFAIEAQGPIWGYGDTFERFQHAMVKPSRGIYRVYVHTNPCFDPSADDPQGKPLTDMPVRTKPGPEIIDKAKKRINDLVIRMLKEPDQLKLDAIHFLASACFTKWTTAYHNKKALNKIVRSIDFRVLEFQKDPKVVEKEWVGAGPAADAVRILAKPLRIYLDHKIEGNDVVRRQAWAEYFAASRGWHAKHRRAYTNQTMIVDLNIFRCNRALGIIYPQWAWPEDKVIRLLQEAAGTQPWSGKVTDNNRPSWSHGRRYMQLTQQGLTRELGYVGGYGEIVCGLTRAMYDATRPTIAEEGDPELKEQLIKMTRARSVFRYPLHDGDGYRSMRLEGVVGWRDWKFPSTVMYAQSANSDGDALDIAAATMDPVLIGYGQQMLQDNQYFKSVEKLLEQRGFGPLTSLLRVPENYQRIVDAPKQYSRLPMTYGEPDFVFADPEIGVVAVKRGEHILYASLYWRARYAVNNLARVHYLTPAIERDATVAVETKFKSSGMVFTNPDQTNAPFNKKFEGAYQDEGMRYSMAGVQQPIAKIPSTVKDFKPGKENIHAGKGDAYVLNYGPFCIAMNCNSIRSFTFDVPASFQGTTNLVTGETVNESRLTVKSEQTVVLCKL